MMTAYKLSRHARRLFALGMIAVLAAVLLGVGTVRPARAATIVNSLLDNGPGNCNTTCTLRDAVTTTPSGGAITFSVTGKIILTGGVINAPDNANITGPGSALLTIDGNNNAGIFLGQIHFSIAGVTLAHASGAPALAVGGVTLSDVIFANNTAGALDLTGEGQSSLDSCQFNSNSGAHGGAIRFMADILTINHCAFTGNTSSGVGGAIDLDNTGMAALITVQNSSFIGNTAAGNGGAIYSNIPIEPLPATLTVSNSTFYNNTVSGSTSGGGAIANLQGVVTLNYDTIAVNSAGGSGGGLYSPALMGVTTNVLVSIIANNIAPVGPDISGSIVSSGYNLFRDESGSCCTLFSDLPAGTNPLLNPPDFNGGYGKTMSLQPASPAINWVPPGSNCTSTLTDQRGVKRPINGKCDIGALEASSHSDKLGVYRRIDPLDARKNYTFYLGTADNRIVATYGFAGCYPVVGDWNGDGIDTIGVYDQAHGHFLLRDLNTSGSSDYNFNLGNLGDQPLSGKWTASATHDGVGVFRPTNGLIYLKNELTPGFANLVMLLGRIGDIGIAGDWTGKGYDTPGVYRPATATFYLSDKSSGTVFDDHSLRFGNTGDNPVTGDWAGIGHDGVGVVRPSNGLVYLKNNLTAGFADTQTVFGIPNDIPVAGHFGTTLNSPPPNNGAPAGLIVPSAPLPTAPTVAPIATAAPIFNADG